MTGVLEEAYKDLMMRLFNKVPTSEELRSGKYKVDRTTYIRTLQEVEKDYCIESHSEEYLPWTLTLIGRSPKIIKEDMEHDSK